MKIVQWFILVWLALAGFFASTLMAQSGSPRLTAVTKQRIYRATGAALADGRLTPREEAEIVAMAEGVFPETQIAQLEAKLAELAGRPQESRLNEPNPKAPTIADSSPDATENRPKTNRESRSELKLTTRERLSPEALASTPPAHDAVNRDSLTRDEGPRKAWLEKLLTPPPARRASSKDDAIPPPPDFDRPADRRVTLRHPQGIVKLVSHSPKVSGVRRSDVRRGSGGLPIPITNTVRAVAISTDGATQADEATQTGESAPVDVRVTGHADPSVRAPQGHDEWGPLPLFRDSLRLLAKPLTEPWKR